MSRLRIVGGALGGRRFRGPVGRDTRPTSDRVREAVMSALDARGLLEGARVLDLFAGTGALAFESLSRGASHATIVEVAREVVFGIRAAANELGLEDRCAIVACDAYASARLARALAPSAAGGFDLVFVDPPYADTERGVAAVSTLGDTPVLANDATVVIEATQRAKLALPPNLATVAEYEYGETRVVIARLSRRSS